MNDTLRRWLVGLSLSYQIKERAINDGDRQRERGSCVEPRLLDFQCDKMRLFAFEGGRGGGAEGQLKECWNLKFEI